MVSQAWKGLERSVAEYFGGTRLIKAHYGVSQPDVYVESYKLRDKEVSLLIECKYSQEQLWHAYVINHMPKDNRLSIIKTDNYMFWEMSNSDVIMPLLDPFSMIRLFYIHSIDKKEPKYLHDMFQQSESYYNNYKKPNKDLKTLICLGQKGAKTRVIGGEIKQLLA